VAPALGVKTVKDFIALGQAKPGQILSSSAGAGSSTLETFSGVVKLAGLRPK